MSTSTGSMIARAELRRRSDALVGLAFLVAIVAFATLTALVGARRSATSVDRFREATDAADLWYQSDGPDSADAMLRVALADGAVRQAGARYLVNAWPTDGSPDIAIMSDPSGSFANRFDRPHVLEGRTPAPGAADEILLNESAAKITGLKVGDRLDARSFAEKDLDELGGDGFPGYNGPRLDLVVVGIGRMPDELSGNLRRTSPYAVASPAFLAAHAGIGAWPPAVGVQLRPGAAHRSLDRAMSKVQQESWGAGGPGGFYVAATRADDIYLDAMRTATRGLVVGLLVFAVAALLAGGVAIGQAVRRQLTGAVVPVAILSTLGMTRSEVARARGRPIAAAAFLGAVVGAGASVAASPVLPIGLVRRAELHTGVWFDPGTVSAGVAVVTLAVWTWAFLVGRASVTSISRRSPRRLPALTRVTATAAASPALATGIRLAGDPGRGTRSIPVRSAFVGIALAMVAVVGTGVVASSFSELASTPVRWGVPWSSSPDYSGEEAPEALLAALAEDRRVDAVANYVSTSFVLDGRVTTVSALDNTKGHMAFPTLSGRSPRSPTEIALGSATAAQLGVSIGDTVSVTPADGSPAVLLTVVGTVVLPATDNEYAVNVGAAATPASLARFGNVGDMTPTPVIRFAPGVDAAAAERDLARAHEGLSFNIFTEPRPSSLITSLADAREVAVGLAVFLAVLALLGTVHAMVLSTRRRDRELGVLRALGLRGVQVRIAVMIEALVLAAAGVVVGAPLGIVVGRAVWRSLVDRLGALGAAGWPVALLVIVGPAAFALAAVASWWPARQAGRRSPALSLRDE